jgi:hypothetical protein
LDEWVFGDHSVLVGFDFPIGLPERYGNKTGFKNFLDALPRLGHGEWGSFFVVATCPAEISLWRPFYRASSRPRGARLAHLLAALSFNKMDDLRRVCEQKTLFRPAACPIFWTLVPNQVGKAAIHGWQNVVRPAFERGARLWPFQGDLAELSQSATCVLCETYPREFYTQLTGEIGSRRGGAKTAQEARQQAGPSLLAWAERHSVHLADDAQKMICDGFGSSRFGDDQFDAVIGLFGMIGVVIGGQNPPPEVCTNWEGWILGQRTNQARKQENYKLTSKSTTTRSDSSYAEARKESKQITRGGFSWPWIAVATALVALPLLAYPLFQTQSQFWSVQSELDEANEQSLPFLKAELRKREQELGEVNEQLVSEREVSQSQIETLNKTANKAKSKLVESERQITALKGALESASRQVEQLTSNRDAAQSKLTEKQSYIKVIFDKAKKTAEQANAKIGEAENATNSAKAEVSKLQSALDRANSEIEILKAKLQLEQVQSRATSAPDPTEADSGVGQR